MLHRYLEEIQTISVHTLNYEPSKTCIFKMFSATKCTLIIAFVKLWHTIPYIYRH